MRKRRFTDEQIVRVLHEWDAGAKVGELVRRHGVTEQTLYRWKKQYGGLQSSEAKRRTALEDENRQLKRLVADQALHLQVVKDLVGNQWCPPGSGGRRLRRRWRWPAFQSDARVAPPDLHGQVAVTAPGARRMTRFAPACTHWPCYDRGGALVASIAGSGAKACASLASACSGCPARKA